MKHTDKQTNGGENTIYPKEWRDNTVCKR